MVIQSLRRSAADMVAGQVSLQTVGQCCTKLLHPDAEAAPEAAAAAAADIQVLHRSQMAVAAEVDILGLHTAAVAEAAAASALDCNPMALVPLQLSAASPSAEAVPAPMAEAAEAAAGANRKSDDPQEECTAALADATVGALGSAYHHEAAEADMFDTKEKGIPQ